MMTQQARTLEEQGRYQDADAIYAEVYLLLNEELGELHPDTVLALNDYAFTRFVLGDAETAAELFGISAALGREVFGDRDVNTLTSLSNQARALLTLGRLDEAEVAVSESLQSFRSILGESAPETLAAQNNYASILEAQGRIDEAVPIYVRVLAARREALGYAHPDTIESLTNYGAALFRLGRFEQARPLMEEAVEAGRSVLGERNLYTIGALMSYGALLEAMGDLEGAEAIHREAVPLQLEVLGQTHPWTLVGLNNLANTLKNQSRYEEAEPLLREAVDLHRQVLGPRHPNTLRLMLNHAKVLTAGRSYEAALARARELTGIMRSRSAGLTQQGVRGTAQRDRELDDRQNYERFYASVLWGSRGRTSSSDVSLAVAAFTALQMASADMTSNAVREAAAARYASDAGMRQDVQDRRAALREWEALEAQLVASETSGQANAATRAAGRQSLSATEARIAAIDERLADGAPQYFAILRNDAVTPAQLQETLAPDEAVLMLVPTDYGTHSMVVTDQGVSWNLAEADSAAIAATVRSFREGLEIEAGSPYLPGFDAQLAYQIYSDLVAPVAAKFAEARRVYVVADGALSRIPMGALITSAAPEGADLDDPNVLRALDWFADSHALVQLPSLQSLAYIRSYPREEQNGPAGQFAGFGAPVLEGEGATRGARSATLPPRDAAGLLSDLRGSSGTFLMKPESLKALAALPGTRTELEQVRDALGAPANALFLEERMTERLIRSTDLSATHVIHFATHGFTSEESGDTAEPGLVFTPPDEARAEDDGYLAASEVIGLNLGSARWVILSACNTASPSGQPGETGLSGLAQAFFYAGAESLLVSHWPVFDDIAPVLTVRALTLSQSGMNRAEALQQAMREVRNDPALDAAHPAVWAPFTLVGEGR